MKNYQNEMGYIMIQGTDKDLILVSRLRCKSAFALHIYKYVCRMRTINYTCDTATHVSEMSLSWFTAFTWTDYKYQIVCIFYRSHLDTNSKSTSTALWVWYSFPLFHSKKTGSGTTMQLKFSPLLLLVVGLIFLYNSQIKILIFTQHCLPALDKS